MASHTEDVEIGGQPNPNHGKAFAKCHEKGKRKRSTTGGKLKLGSKRSTTSIKDKHKAKLSQDLDLSTSESCNPSYKLVPRDVIASCIVNFLFFIRFPLYLVIIVIDCLCNTVS